MRWLVGTYIAILALCLVFLWGLAMLEGATKGGRNAGAFEEQSIQLFLMGLGIPVAMVLGIALGLVAKLFKMKN
jgi:hypothetical protein